MDASRSFSQVEKERGVVRWEARRLFVEREMRTREMLGNFWLRAESWERKWRPTPPAPGGCQTCRECFCWQLKETSTDTGNVNGHIISVAICSRTPRGITSRNKPI